MKSGCLVFDLPRPEAQILVTQLDKKKFDKYWAMVDVDKKELLLCYQNLRELTHFLHI